RGDGGGRRHPPGGPAPPPRARAPGGAVGGGHRGGGARGPRAPQPHGVRGERRQRGRRPLPGAHGVSLQPKILVADDDQALCRTLAWILKDNGSEVVTLPGGENLIEHLLADQYDLLILDIMMPKADGLQLPEQVQADRRPRPLPVLMPSSGPPGEGPASAPPTSSPSRSGCASCWPG